MGYRIASAAFAVLLSLIAATPVFAGTTEDVKAAAKSSTSGSLIKDVSFSKGTATITYGSMGASDWTGDSRGRTAARCVAKVLQKVPQVKKVIIQIESSYRVVATRKDAEKFYGPFATADQFKANVVDGVVYDKTRLAAWEKKFVTVKK